MICSISGNVNRASPVRSVAKCLTSGVYLLIDFLSPKPEFFGALNQSLRRLLTGEREGHHAISVTKNDFPDNPSEATLLKRVAP